MIDTLVNGPYRAQVFGLAYAVLAIVFGWLGTLVLTDHFSKPAQERESIGILGGIVVIAIAGFLAVMAVQSFRGVIR